MEMIKETAKVVRQQQIDEGIFDMELSFPKGAALAKPGQFIVMYCNDKSKLLPRPISICGINKEEGTLRVVYRVAGEGTKEFSEMKEGDTLEVMGPLGNGFALKEEKAIIIGGGIGIPPMLELAKQLNVEKTVVLGYRTSTFLKDEFEAVCDVKVATEDGSQGTKGTVIDAIEKLNQRMKIPAHFEGIQEKDIPLMAKHAAKEANPLYPVPKLMDAKELEKFYYMVM